MGVRVAAITKTEQDALLVFLRKNPVYPFRKRFNVAVNNTTFDTANAASPVAVRSMTLSWRPTETVGIVSLAVGAIVTPNTTVDVFGVVISYKPTLTLADGTHAEVPDNESDDIYQVLSNGGAINDFQDFYPLNWLVERGQYIYAHIFAGTTTCTAATSSIMGHVIFGTLKGGI